MDQLYIKQQLSNLKNLIEIVNPRLANYLGMVFKNESTFDFLAKNLLKNRFLS